MEDNVWVNIYLANSYVYSNASDWIFKFYKNYGKTLVSVLFNCVFNCKVFDFSFEMSYSINIF